MIHSFRITLKTDGPPAGPNPGYRLYGALMERLTPELCERLHGEGFAPLAQHAVRRGEDVVWTVNTFDSDVAEGVARALKEGPAVWQTDAGVFRTADIAESEVGSVVELRNSAGARFGDARRLSVRLLTPTAFKQNGQYVLYPTVSMTVGNLVRRWNAWIPEIGLEDEFVLNALEEGISVAGYRLRSAVYRIKNGTVTGFTGELDLRLRLPEATAEIARLLFCFAEYAGIGIKTALGMGGAEVVAKTGVRTAGGR